MRRIANLSMCVLSCVGMLTAGCTLPGERAHWGCEVRWYKPALVTGENSTLIQADSGTVSGHPMGTVAGPVIQGAFQHAAKGVGAMQLAPGGVRQTYVEGPCQPSVNGGLMTCEQWCQVFKAMQTHRMPNAPE